MVKIGIIGAMDEEIEMYLSELDGKEKETKASLDFYSGVFNAKEVVVVKSGAGKVNAALCTQILVSYYDIDMIIFSGVAGALNPELELFDIVISKDTIQHDMDARALGFELGHVLFSDMKYFEASRELIDIAELAAKGLKLKAIVGRILTGDQFITDKSKTQKMIESFQGDCVDMESAAIGQVCSLNNKPFLIIRSISDKADHSAQVDFPKFVKEASINSFKLVNEIISNY